MIGHVAAVRTYYLVFAALLTLTGLTVAVTFAPLGHLHTPIALGIACTKAVLVFLFFMHLLYSPRLTWLVAGGAFLWLGILIALTLSDYWSRDVIRTFP